MLQASPTPALELADAPPFDLLRLPVLGRFLAWKHVRTAVQIPILLVSGLMVLHGLVGPSLAPKNFATTLTWLHFRGLLVLALLAVGNLFCFACPFVFARDIARKLIRPRFAWPRKLRNKWPSIILFVAFLFVYELFDLWSSSLWTAWLIVGYFAAALAIDVTFKHATFCKFVCPIGQFNFVASSLSPLEVKVRDQEVCGECMTKDCIRGTRAADSKLVVIQRGCELALFQPQKVGNMDCTFCLDCVHACPHDNVGMTTRVPGAELMSPDEQRSGIGHFSRRTDISVLVMLFTFGALLNAFGMVSPVYMVENWLSRVLDVNREMPVLASIFVVFLVLEPLVLLGLAARLSSKWSDQPRALVPQVTRYSYGLAPLGFGIWLAHYSFHFLTGMFTLIPVVQSAIADLGHAWLGEPRWTLTGLAARSVQPVQFGFLMLGVAGSLLVMYRLAEQDGRDRRLWTFAPWATVCVLLWAGAVWLMFQPMEMRATFMSS